MLDVDYTLDGMPCLFEFSYEIDLLHKIYNIIDGYDKDCNHIGQGHYFNAPRWVGETINEFFDEDFIIDFHGGYCNIYMRKVCKVVSMNYAQKYVIMSQIEKHEKKMAEIDAIWEARGVKDATAEPEWDYYETLLMVRCELGLGIE